MYTEHTVHLHTDRTLWSCGPGSACALGLSVSRLVPRRPCQILPARVEGRPARPLSCACADMLNSCHVCACPCVRLVGFSLILVRPLFYCLAHGSRDAPAHGLCPCVSPDRTRAPVSLCSIIRRRRQVAHVLIGLVVHELAFILLRTVFAEGHDLVRVRVRVKLKLRVGVGVGVRVRLSLTCLELSSHRSSIACARRGSGFVATCVPVSRP